jgi:hypothetical protein
MSQAGALSGSEVGPDVPTSFVTDNGTAVASLGVINIFGGSGSTTSGSGNTITINVSGSSFTWNVVTSAMNPITLVAENGYICKGAAPVDFILPPASTIGQTYRIVGYGNLWTVAQNAGQSITIGNQTTTVGVFGGLTATMISDAIELLCVTNNSEFYEIGIQGNPILN